MVFRNLQTPKEENVDQVQLYMHFFKVKKGILLYVNKDNQELKEFVLDYNPLRAENLIENLKQLKVKIDSDIVPSRIPTYPSDWQCQYCAFKEICKMANEGEMKWREFRKKIEKVR